MEREDEENKRSEWLKTPDEIWNEPPTPFEIVCGIIFIILAILCLIF